MPADERARRLLHRRGVEFALHTPGAAALEGQRRAAIDDAIEVMAHDRAAARVEMVCGPLGFEHGDGMGNEMRVDRLAQAPAPPLAFEIDMRDLPHRVNAGVGAAGAVDDEALAGQRRQRLFQRLLHRGAVRLALPTRVIRAVVFDRQLVARHGAAHTVSTILPTWAELSMRRCASAASASAKTESTTGLQRPCASSGQTLRVQRLGDRRLFRHRARAQRRAGVEQALGHDDAQVDLDLLPAQERDLHDASVDRRRGVIARDVVAADHVENDVGALAVGRRERRRDEILRAVVDRAVGAERHALPRPFRPSPPSRSRARRTPWRAE